MSRIYYNPLDGSDSTSAVTSALFSSNTFVIADLFMWQSMDFVSFNPYADYLTWCYTNADFPIETGYLQLMASGSAPLGTWDNGFTAAPLTFIPEKFNHPKLEYGIGFENRTVEVDWFIDDSKQYPSSGGGVVTENCYTPKHLTLKQALLLGAFDECNFWIHRAVYSDSPNRGGTLLGTTLMHRGFIRSVEAALDHLKITVAALIDLFQVIKIPTQTITPNSRSVPYLPAVGAPPGFPGLISNVTVGAVNALDSLTLVSDLGSFAYARDVLKDCYISFCPFIDGASYPFGILAPNGMSPPPTFRICGNDATTTTSCVLYFYKPPIVGNGSFVNIFGQASYSTGAPGFRSVPPPEFGV
jgi:hypothetical protein